MLLIGTFEWASTRMRGMFLCPNCESTQQFRLRASRPFLTLYFVPIIPIGGLQEFVQCTQCKTSYETDILTTTMMSSKVMDGTPTSAQVTTMAGQVTGMAGRESEQESEPTVAFEEDLLKSIALMMIEDGHVSESEIKIARRLYENITEDNISREELGRACSFVQLHRLTTLSFLATARGRCSHEQKLLLVQAMFGVAGADGKITPGRMDALLKAADVLGLDKTEFEQAVLATSQWLA